MSLSIAMSRGSFGPKMYAQDIFSIMAMMTSAMALKWPAYSELSRERWLLQPRKSTPQPKAPIVRPVVDHISES